MFKLKSTTPAQVVVVQEEEKKQEQKKQGQKKQEQRKGEYKKPPERHHAKETTIPKERLAQNSIEYAYSGDFKSLANCKHIDPRAITLGQNTETTRFLLDKGFSPSIDDDLALLNAVRIGNYDTVVMLVEAGANPASHNNLPIISAAEQGYDRILSYLISRPNTNYNAREGKALQLAKKYNRKRCVAVLEQIKVQDTLKSLDDYLEF